MERNSKIYVAGHTGLVGSAIVNELKRQGFANIISKTIDELDLINTLSVRTFFEKEKPDYVVIAAAKVGGILANATYRAQFIYENLMIQNSIIHAAYQNGVKKLLFLGSSCIYPKEAPQPIKEEYLLTGPLEYTNEPYAIAKIAGIKMCEAYYNQYNCNFISVMPTNLYGPNDNYNLDNSHVLPAMIRKIHLAKCIETNNWKLIKRDLTKRPIENVDPGLDKQGLIEALKKYGIRKNDQRKDDNVTLSLWGSGTPRREFMYVDDMANACLHVLQNVDANQLYNKMKLSHINIGLGTDLRIAELSQMIKKIIGFSGEILWDTTKPDGPLQKLLDVSVLEQSKWKHQIELLQGINLVYRKYLKEILKS